VQFESRREANQCAVLGSASHKSHPKAGDLHLSAQTGRTGRKFAGTPESRLMDKTHSTQGNRGFLHPWYFANV
jgi:hypothetical protein